MVSVLITHSFSLLPYFLGVEPYICDVEGAMHRNYSDMTTLSNRVSMLNPGWRDELTPELERQRFEQAIAMCKQDFMMHADYIVNVSLFLCYSFLLHSIQHNL